MDNKMADNETIKESEQRNYAVKKPAFSRVKRQSFRLNSIDEIRYPAGNQNDLLKFGRKSISAPVFLVHKSFNRDSDNNVVS